MASPHHKASPQERLCIQVYFERGRLPKWKTKTGDPVATGGREVHDASELPLATIISIRCSSVARKSGWMGQVCITQSINQHLNQCLVWCIHD